MNNKRRRKIQEDHPNESWLLPYSDLMTLLLALFIVLYSVSTINKTKLEELSVAFKSVFNDGLFIFDASTDVTTGDIESPTNLTKRMNPSGKSREQLQWEEQRNLEQLKDQLNQYIQANGLSSELDVELNYSELKITIRDNALFDSGSAAIKPDARRLAVAIGQMLEPYNDYDILVTGHTDNQPIHTAEFPSNWELSFKRAINFMKILLENPKFDPKYFSATAYGEYQPVATNDTPEGRAKNRRVEVAILRKFVAAGESANTSLTVNP